MSLWDWIFAAWIFDHFTSDDSDVEEVDYDYSDDYEDDLDDEFDEYMDDEEYDDY